MPYQNDQFANAFRRLRIREENNNNIYNNPLRPFSSREKARLQQYIINVYDMQLQYDRHRNQVNMEERVERIQELSNEEYQSEAQAIFKTYRDVLVLIRERHHQSMEELRCATPARFMELLEEAQQLQRQLRERFQS
ncbi:hypothetical protein CAEBREN_22033 [Caenorhabditis brenneri]|uniref:Uncharacterized protein n=1 Tax=Caenorhabditis brenneri TaxID=135651 RepID=G0NQJ0_CAEBE|nr:hypothetical protein CAEBREN_22033 [Caenorhabditis brenneri]